MQSLHAPPFFGRDGGVSFLPHSPRGRGAAAVAMNIPCITTVQGASAAVQGIESAIRGDIDVRSLQELHAALGGQ